MLRCSSPRLVGGVLPLPRGTIPVTPGEVLPSGGSCRSPVVKKFATRAGGKLLGGAVDGRVSGCVPGGRVQWLTMGPHYSLQ
jgi:hypothetical protein